MTEPGKDLLTTTEGVDEGSAASTAEGPDTGGGAATSGPGTAPGNAGADAQPAPPVDMETSEARAARDATGPGQQLEAGEG